MAKPIFLLSIPNYTLEKQEQQCLCDNLKERLSDYHVVIIGLPTDEISVKVLAEKDYKEIDLENLTNSVKELFSK